MLKNLGERIRQFRKQRGLTLVEISKRTGVAQATLSRIETGTMTGTVESHEKIAEAIGIGLAELYGTVDSRLDKTSVLKKDAEHKTSHLGKNVSVELLTTESSQKKITPLLITLQGKSQTPTEQTERGVEKFVYALEGEAKVNLEKDTFELKSGDSLYFDASIPHHIVNETAKTCRLIAAISPSKL
ncbi:MAG: helix-turn-helix transcriptional regulator [Candidatus Omnitrophica bacterium]|nr:helix-turn-helix transcriptional regulator [Candidatus Omnitrophota bacterium]